MAKKETTEAVPGAKPLSTGPTPENTPPPGGGRWRWDITKPGWVDLDAANAPAAPAFPELPAH